MPLSVGVLLWGVTHAAQCWCVPARSDSLTSLSCVLQCPSRRKSRSSLLDVDAWKDDCVDLVRDMLSADDSMPFRAAVDPVDYPVRNPDPTRPDWRQLVVCRHH